MVNVCIAIIPSTVPHLLPLKSSRMVSNSHFSFRSPGFLRGIIRPTKRTFLLPRYDGLEVALVTNERVRTSGITLLISKSGLSEEDILVLGCLPLAHCQNIEVRIKDSFIKQRTLS